MMTDPDFKARIVRITDAITNPDHLNFNYSGGGGGSGDVNVWNNDSTILMVEDEGGRYFPFSFDPATMHATPLYGTSPNLLETGPGEFDHFNSNIFYSFVGGNSMLMKRYDFADRVNRPHHRVRFRQLWRLKRDLEDDGGRGRQRHGVLRSLLQCGRAGAGALALGLSPTTRPLILAISCILMEW